MARHSLGGTKIPGFRRFLSDAGRGITDLDLALEESLNRIEAGVIGQIGDGGQDRFRGRAPRLGTGGNGELHSVQCRIQVPREQVSGLCSFYLTTVEALEGVGAPPKPNVPAPVPEQ
jgi:hypothetical protein